MYRHGGDAVRGGDMVEQEALQGPQLAAVEAQLHALLRKQAKHALPVDLPRPDFWNICSQLLQSIEMELAETNRLEGFSARAQTLSRRQANLRRAVADLTRHRLTAFVNHAALANLASTPFGDAAAESSQNMVPVDWQRQDGAERAFHSGVSELIEQYKRNVSWRGLQEGVLETTITPTPTTPSGNAQLDEFVEGGLTEQPPPPIEVSNPEEEWEDPDVDEEDRISMMEEYPEISETGGGDESSDENESGDSTAVGTMMRLRILKDMPEPILDESGEEIELLEGDSFNCVTLMAETLIAAGWAEAVTLE
ncbi:MAG TPA: hypothetical protein QF716_03670 [Candidatus Thalassarchaeaceae archaeon]|nr:hypothetical protein [Candidatus Thalassarchaeaceae archaeon]HJM67957.1 hypothetical protein [Candidatus Thalassarchaeaceae archaeon]